MKKVIFDCDNTMGLHDCDVDDGLALLYLFGKSEIELCGITTTYGNSDVETVYRNTEAMLTELGRRDIPLLKGCAGKGAVRSEATEFLLETVRAHPGEISILATGSLTNLLSAYQADEKFFAYVDEIVLMGGYTEELVINGRTLDELNFSCDHLAADCVLGRGRRVSCITGNNCLKAYFSESDFRQRLEFSEKPIAHYILQKCSGWFHSMMKNFQIDGFYNWDVVAAAYLAEPSLFCDCPRWLKQDLPLLQRGYLHLTDREKADGSVNLPEIRDVEAFAEDVYSSWLNAKVRL